MLQFSLSHTVGLAMCAVAVGRDVGVDVELLREPAPLDVAERFFARPEVLAVRALCGAEQADRFFTYWTVKESYLKARGPGLSLPMDKFLVHLNGVPSPRIECHPTLDRWASAWRFSSSSPTPSHRAATCVWSSDASTVDIVTSWDAPWARLA
jgi:4'-phosphopantetheinyl transferase